MRRIPRTFAAVLGAAVVALMVSAVGASASFHLMRIRAIFLGNGSTTSFVELQMIADGQNLVGGQKICVYPNSGFTCSAYNLSSNVPNGGNQRTILIGETGVANRDFTAAGLGSDLSTFASAGALCYSNIDCVSWGSFSNVAALPSPAGTPMAGLSPTMVASRTIARGCPTALDAADDTDNSQADFSFGVGFPLRSNSAVPTETLCSTTGAPAAKKKCKKHKKKTGAYSAKKKKCKKKKH